MPKKSVASIIRTHHDRDLFPFRRSFVHPPARRSHRKHARNYRAAASAHLICIKSEQPVVFESGGSMCVVFADVMGARHGRVVIDFANLEDLERIYRVILEGREATD